MSGLRVTDPGRRTRAQRLAFNLTPVCPAATPVYETARGAGVRCSVERNTLKALDDPSALAHFCCGNYVLCTSWQWAKNEGWKDGVPDDRPAPKLDASELIEMNRELAVTHFQEPEC